MTEKEAPNDRKEELPMTNKKVTAMSHRGKRKKETVRRKSDSLNIA